MEAEADPLYERIQERLRATGKSERGAAEAAGLSAAAIKNIREGKSQSPRLETIRKLAPVLETTPEWLAFGLRDGVKFGGGVSNGAPSISDPAVDEAQPALTDGVIAMPARFVRAIYGGPVEAGSFRTVEFFDDFEHMDEDERPPIWHAPDREYPDLELVEYDVVGDSMNALKPRAILPGDKVVTIPFAAFKGNFALRDGLIVVVEQTSDGGHHRERSVKQLELYVDRIEFHPRSANKKHKPIVVPRTVFTDPSEGDGREVSVLAVARRIVNDLPNL